MKYKIKLTFARKCHILALSIIFALIAGLILDHYLPISSGSYNQKQIDKIYSSSPSNQFSFAVMGDNKNNFKIFKKF